MKHNDKALKIVAMVAAALQVAAAFGVSVGAYMEWLENNQLAAVALVSGLVGVVQTYLPVPAEKR
jgi:hypothetical protein